MEALTALLDQVGDAGGAVVISAISGTAGIGKTALAVHWAHRVCHRFPDGQLYVNLRGFDPTGSVVPPAEVLRYFLDALGVPLERIPVDLDARAGLFRSLLATKRVLILLDNAHDTVHVRPLLPGAPGCLVLVTSRNQLSSLVAVDGAHPITVDLLTTAEARQVLTNRLGAARVAAEPDAAEKIVTACARLPLALTVAAAHAATQPAFPLAVLADNLGRAGGALDVLAGEDPSSDLRAVFSWSYRSLHHDSARMFRLLGLHPGPDVAVAAAASLAGVAVAEVRPLLADLIRAHLIIEHTPGRYTFHDLLRSYAREQAHTVDSHADRQAALHRVLDHYLHTAHAAVLLLDPQRDPLTLRPPHPGVPAEGFVDRAQALNWFNAERDVLRAALDQAAEMGLDALVWRLVWALADFLERQGRWQDWVDTQRSGRSLADRLKQAFAHRILGRAYAALGRYDDALDHLQHAVRLYGQLNNETGQAHVHLSLNLVYDRRGRHRDALRHAQQAFDLYRAVGDDVGQANALNAIGWNYAQLCNYPHRVLDSSLEA
jgi:tetratricopeptide (TPR) repeat protein